MRGVRGLFQDTTSVLFGNHAVKTVMYRLDIRCFIEGW